MMDLAITARLVTADGGTWLRVAAAVRRWNIHLEGIILSDDAVTHSYRKGGFKMFVPAVVEMLS